MTFRRVGTPQEHVRTALHLLGELEGQARVAGTIMTERYLLVRLLAAMRRQLWLAVAALESQRSTPRWWVRSRRVGRKHGWAVTVLFEVVAWGALAVAFALRSAWNCIWAVLRVVRMLRAL